MGGFFKKQKHSKTIFSIICLQNPRCIFRWKTRLNLHIGDNPPQVALLKIKDERGKHWCLVPFESDLQSILSSCLDVFLFWNTGFATIWKANVWQRSLPVTLFALSAICFHHPTWMCKNWSDIAATNGLATRDGIQRTFELWALLAEAGLRLQKLTTYLHTVPHGSELDQKQFRHQMITNQNIKTQTPWHTISLLALFSAWQDIQLTWFTVYGGTWGRSVFAQTFRFCACSEATMH